MDLYSNEDLLRTRRALSRRWIVLGVLVAITAAAMVVALVFRHKLPGVIGVALGACACFSYFSLKITPWLKYGRFLKDMSEGLSRETSGWMVSFAKDARTVDGVRVHDMIIRVGDADEDERLFLWDDDKAFQPLPDGQKVRIVSYSNFVKSLIVE